MNDNKKIYVISNSNTKLIDDNVLKRQEELQRKQNNQG